MKKKDLIKKYCGLGIKETILNKIILDVLNVSNKELFLLEEIDKKSLQNIEKKINRLLNGEPLEYIIKKSDFFSLEFIVKKGVLIPRNDTEILVEVAIKESNKFNDVLLIDVGTGTSCIPISIIKNSKIENSIVIDISKYVLNLSKKNIIKHNLKGKIKQLNSNLIEKILNKKIKNKNLIITANLPYIKNGDFENMSKETLIYEPSLALFGGEKTGFELYEKLIYQIIDLKNNNKFENILLFIEIGFDQEDCSKLFLNNLNLKFEYFKDNNKINRCVKIVF